MDKLEIKYRKKLSNLQYMNLIGFILFSVNHNFGIKILFIPLVFYFAIIIVLTLKLFNMLKEHGFKQVKRLAWRTLITCSIFILICLFAYFHSYLGIP